ncbi:hypothetical protein C0J52_18926 [Blattella germanica]|nr:hypothetical protein C0J52_18926 [Blattella germanica]
MPCNEEIKIYTGLPHGSTDNHVAIVGGLAEAARGQSSRTKGGTLDDHAGSASRLCPSLTAAIVMSVFITTFCAR